MIGCCDNCLFNGKKEKCSTILGGCNGGYNYVDARKKSNATKPFMPNRTREENLEMLKAYKKGGK